MGSLKQVPTYGGGPRIASKLEPLESPSSESVRTYGPTLVPVNKGEKQVGGPSGPLYPEVYGGGAVTGPWNHQQKKASGNGIGGTGVIP